MKLALLTLASAVCAQANLWRAYAGLSTNAYQKRFDELVSQGYRLTSVDGYVQDDEPAFAVIFEQKPSPAWRSHSGLTSDQYHAKFEDYLNQGYHVVQVNGYTVNGTDYYAAIWDKSPVGPWASRHGMSTKGTQKYFNAYRDEGYRMTHISGYEVSHEARYAAVWEKSDDNSTAWESRGNLTASQYQSTFDDFVKKGYRPVHVDGYEVDGEVYYAAIFEKSSSGPWVAHHGLNAAAFQKEFDALLKKGYALRTLSAYNDGDKPLFAGIWVKP
ncbi:hypothetical protein EYZ11_004299 [Aspergillus tanneri]|uniref:Uncharacterized protein n=1 Tax=Aspergillus tanneri TaxID=1220188 RepID=A0A4S3JRR8_9EURO|nr:uncharacterized protein ATNIH1004_003683 [Aspergillus tanneri]KAA8650992.1 hypothetical protein ATNIH1004_003683 [Aspergillus tanneri]THC96221.1 hypothetical protein EYZ11_004299 [Aspergillus tanneri]